MYRTLLASITRLVRGCSFAAIGTSAYILGFAIQFKWDFPFIALIIFAALSLAFDFHKAPSARPAGLMFVLLFVVSFGLSTYGSDNVDLSLKLGAPLLPAGLVFLLIAGQFRSLLHVRMALFSFSVVTVAI